MNTHKYVELGITEYMVSKHTPPNDDDEVAVAPI